MKKHPDYDILVSTAGTVLKNGRSGGPEFKKALAEAVGDYLLGLGSSRKLSSIYGVSKTHLLRVVKQAGQKGVGGS